MSTKLPPQSLPEGVNAETATDNGAYTPQEVHSDAREFGDWVQTGTWVYHVLDDAVYYMDATHPPYTFTLTPGEQIHPNTTAEQSTEAYNAQSVTQLSGEMQAGYIICIPPGETIVEDGTVFTNTGKYLFIYTDDSDAESLRDVSITRNQFTLRFTDGTPASLTNTPDDTESLTTPNIVCSVTGEKDHISHLLTTQTEPQTNTGTNSSQPQQQNNGQPAESNRLTFEQANDDLTVRFVPTGQHPAATFEEPNLRKYVLHHMEGRVLNACAGPTRLDKWYDAGDIARNDINPDINSDVTADIAELPLHFDESSFDVIVFDPPWTAYQSRLRYDNYHVHKSAADSLPVSQINIDVRDLPFKVPGEDAVEHGDAQQTLDGLQTDTPDKPATEYPDYINPEEEKNQLGHARLAKIGFDYLLKDGGKVIQFAYTGSIMPSGLGYTQVDRTAFDPVGIYKTLWAGVDKNTH